MDDQSLAELKIAIGEYQSASTEALAAAVKDVKNLTRQVDTLEVRLNRPGAMSSFKSTNGDLAA